MEPFSGHIAESNAGHITWKQVWWLLEGLALKKKENAPTVIVPCILTYKNP